MSIKNGPFWWLRHARRTFIFTKSPRQSQFLSSGKQKLWPKIFHCQWHDRMSDHYFLARLKRFRTLSLNNLLHMIEFLMIRRKLAKATAGELPNALTCDVIIFPLKQKRNWSRKIHYSASKFNFSALKNRWEFVWSILHSGATFFYEIISDKLLQLPSWLFERKSSRV